MSDAAADELQKAHQEAIVQIVEGRSEIDARLLRLSDWLNPILVKETRQALKSQQFLWTFIMVLLAIVGLTVAGVTLMLPGIYYLPGGPSLLIGYFIILMVPVGIVVPMSSFFSMSSELEDGTHDILSLSALSSRQIVLGKIQVSMLQSIVYFSALTPCIGLTYLLRGVGIDYILLILAGTFGISLLASTTAILFATLTRTRTRQIFLVLLLFGLLSGATIAWISTAASLIRETMPIDQPGFWWVMAGILGIGGAYLWLAVLVAAAKIGIATENHSTAIRKWLLVPHALWLCFAIWLERLAETNGEHWFFFLSVLGIHWGFAGVAIVGESGAITPRARRTLPASPAARLFLTWTNPGAGPGYVFCVLNSASIFLGLTLIIPWMMSPNWRGPVAEFALAITCYIALYLGVSRLIILALGRFVTARMVTVVAVLFLLVVFGIAIPMCMSFWANNFRTIDYEYYSFTHFPWTLMLLVENNNVALVSVQWLTISSCLVFLANLLLASRDVMLIRLAVPDAVLKETQPEVAKQFDQVDPLAPDS